MGKLLPLLVPLALAPVGAAAGDPAPQVQAWLALPARIPHPADSIEIEALTLQSDFSVFMRPDCPEPLRRRALRKLWTLLPQRAEAGPTTH